MRRQGGGARLVRPGVLSLAGRTSSPVDTGATQSAARMPNFGLHAHCYEQESGNDKRGRETRHSIGRSPPPVPGLPLGLSRRHCSPVVSCRLRHECGLPARDRSYPGKRKSFFVYENGDSGFNHGFPSGFFGAFPLRMPRFTSTPPVSMILDCPRGSTDATRIDRERGTVVQMVFDPLERQRIAGVNFEEPENWGAHRRGKGTTSPAPGYSCSTRGRPNRSTSSSAWAAASHRPQHCPNL